MSRRFSDAEEAAFLERMRRDDALVEYLEFLDNLRASGVTNMYGAPRYVEDEFAVGPAEARAIVGEWMQTFSARKAAGEVTS